MSNKGSNLKEKFKIALTSTAKVISDDFTLSKKTFENRSFTGIKRSDLGRLLESQRKKKAIPILDPIRVKSKSKLSEYHVNNASNENSRSKSPAMPPLKTSDVSFQLKQKRLREKAEALKIDKNY